MISMRKQLFTLLLCTGSITIVLTALSVNMTLHNKFSSYIHNNIEKTSMLIVEQLEDMYEQTGSWDTLLQSEFWMRMQVDNFAVAILSPDKELIWGMTEHELAHKIKALDYPLFYGANFKDIENGIYSFEDIPIEASGETIGYARIGYFPSFLLETEDIKFQTSINQSLVITGLVAMSCFVIVGAYVTRLFTKPIYAVAKASVDVAEGKYDTRYSKHSRIIELENLRHSMNYLAQTLEKQDALRRKLISDVSHEIRTPLHILQSNLEAMIDGIYPIDEEQMQVLYQEVVRFGSLLNNLDKLKNIEQDVPMGKKEEIYINTCLKEIYHTFKIVAKERNIKYKLNIQETQCVRVQADLGALKQILMNIVSNAFKFTQKGTITITTSVHGRMLRIAIEDTGIGIDEEDIPYVFERMYRGDKSREQYEGSGLGLTIVKKLVDAHRGKISIESKAGEGTCVIIDLPISRMSKTKMLKTLALNKVDPKE